MQTFFICSEKLNFKNTERLSILLKIASVKKKSEIMYNASNAYHQFLKFEECGYFQLFFYL